MSEIKVGDVVEFKGQDSYYKGEIVEDDRGLLLIKNPRSAEKCE